MTGDTVAHCGDNIAGSYAHTLTVTDLASTWTSNRALWQKGMLATKEAMRSIEESFPFEITGFKSDCGSEFINKELFGYFVQRDNPVCFYRSRPYQKNDNCHVEQKNLTHVRRLFGYERFDDPDLIDLMNDIYVNYWNPLQNYFVPTMKLVVKNRIDGKIRKIFDAPKTPYDRVIQSPHISEEKKDLLKSQKKKLNPFHLRLGLEVKLKELKEKVSQESLLRVV